MKKLLLKVVMVLLVVPLVGCVSWYTSIQKNSDGTYTMTRNVRDGLLFGGPRAQLWTGNYDATTNTMTIVKKIELLP